jgi:hypothetical protein
MTGQQDEAGECNQGPYGHGDGGGKKEAERAIFGFHSWCLVFIFGDRQP